MYSVVLLMALSGGADAPAAHGCNGCNGCHGGRSHGCNGCNGCNGCHGGRSRGGRRHNCHGCNGCYGCNGCHGSYNCCGCYGYAAPACGCYGGAPAGDKKDKDAKPLPKPGKDGEEATIAAPATVVVNLPADAKLSVDDYLTTSTSTTRVFVSPALTPGKDFTYTLKGEIVRDGKTVVATKQISVRAGVRTNVNLEFPVAVASR
jgi:uncharacterized protein (TIGR03000 family)